MAKRPEKILLATKNRGKVAELQALVATLGVQICSVAEWETVLGQSAPQVVENGKAFLANALLKARAYCRWSGLPVVADDSGLCVDALDGAPGVDSSSYAGVEGDDAANNNKLLEQLRNVPDAERTARFHATTVYLATPEAEPVVASADWPGLILRAPRGAAGFGYDPLFWLPEYGCSSAELLAATKNRLSHRGQAIAKLLAQLERMWSE